jgi:hypothetical protein
MSHTPSLELPGDAHQALLKRPQQVGKSPEAFAVQLLVSAQRHFRTTHWSSSLGRSAAMGLTGLMNMIHTLGFPRTR